MRYTEINHFSHDHLLKWKDPGEPFRCNGCNQLGFGPCYECDSCNFHLHDECATTTPNSSTYHPFLRNCNLQFHEESPIRGGRYCDACGNDILGFVYQCTHSKPHDLHPCCANLQQTLSADGVTLHLREKLPSRCSNCGRKEITKGVQGWCYVSSCGEYCYHIACVKSIVLKSWKMGYFRRAGVGSEMMNALALPEPVSSSREVAPRRRDGSSKVRRYLKKAKTVIMLIISAIFGDPTTLILTLVQELFSN